MKLLADLILVVHALFVAFVVSGLLLTLIGGLLQWRWVQNGWFRSIHLVCIGIVVLQSWFGRSCPSEHPAPAPYPQAVPQPSALRRRLDR